MSSKQTGGDQQETLHIPLKFKDAVRGFLRVKPPATPDPEKPKPEK